MIIEVPSFSQITQMWLWKVPSPHHYQPRPEEPQPP